MHKLFGLLLALPLMALAEVPAKAAAPAVTPMAAAGILAIEKMSARLGEDHATARQLAAGLAALDRPGLGLFAQREAEAGTIRHEHAAAADLLAEGILANEGPIQLVGIGSRDQRWEMLVRDMLRPQLAEWLDRNLPPIVEKLVAAEIARIVGKKP